MLSAWMMKGIESAQKSFASFGKFGIPEGTEGRGGGNGVARLLVGVVEGSWVG